MLTCGNYLCFTFNWEITVNGKKDQTNAFQQRLLRSSWRPSDGLRAEFIVGRNILLPKSHSREDRFSSTCWHWLRHHQEDYVFLKLATDNVIVLARSQPDLILLKRY